MAKRAQLTETGLAALGLPSPRSPSRHGYQRRGAAGWSPSPQQADFLRWVSQGRGSALLEAVAGAGKTTTLVQALLRMEGKVFFGAYNRKIANEIKAKAAELRADRPGVFINTMHGAGFSHWRRTAPDCEVNEQKVDRIIKDMAHDDAEVLAYSTFISRMVSLGKNFLIGATCAMDHGPSWDHLLNHFATADTLPDGDVGKGMAYMLQAYKRSADTLKAVIDFDDMIFAPIYKSVRFFENDWVLIDECQDTNPARIALARRMLKPGGRLVAVGDSRQAIYGFTGAEADAVDKIAELFKCQRMPLTVTYRCPKAVVAHAHQWVQHIQAHESAPEGVVRPVAAAQPMQCPVCQGGKPDCLQCLGKGTIVDPRPWFLRDRPRTSDAILCRYTRPLVQTAFAMLKAGIGCRIEGRDVGRNLIQLAQRWKITSLDRLEERLASYLANEKAKEQPDAKKQQVEDMVETLRVFIERARAQGKNLITQVVADIDQLFADEVRGVVTLSTGHKAKGREWPRVYWLEAAQRMPNLKDWELVQEDNIKYVICTRAQEELVLVPEGVA